jgi:hypothetical protein
MRRLTSLGSLEHLAGGKMSRCTSLLSALAVGLLASACADQGITDPALDALVQPQAQVVAAAPAEGMVPFKWTYHMTPSSGNTLPCTYLDGSPAPLSVPVDYSGTGHASHLGRIDPEATAAQFTSCVVNIAEGTAAGDISLILVGANGDAVYMEGVLTVSFADFSATGEWTITGGSGRFTGASGWVSTFEKAAEDGSGSVGSGLGMITPPGALGH